MKLQVSMVQINTACSGHLVAWILGEVGVEERMRQAVLGWRGEQLASSSHLLLLDAGEHPEQGNFWDKQA
jgi:hypothetical protein